MGRIASNVVASSQISLGGSVSLADVGAVYGAGDTTMFLKSGVLIDGTAYGADSLIANELLLPIAARTLLSSVQLNSAQSLFFQPESIKFGGGFYSPVYNGTSLWVAGGAAGLVYTSTNGTSWTPVVMGSTAPMYHVAYGGGIFMGVDGNNNIYTSSNGTTWSLVNTVSALPGGTVSANVAWIVDLVYANSKFVVLYGSSSVTPKLATSTNGTSWTMVPIPTNYAPIINSQTWPGYQTSITISANGTNFAINVPWSGSGIFQATLTTTDFLSWTTASSIPVLGACDLASTTANTKLVGFTASYTRDSSQYTSFMAVSTDNSATWTLSWFTNASFTLNGFAPCTVLFNGSTYVALPNNSIGGSTILYSTDRTTWNASTLPIAPATAAYPFVACVGGTTFAILANPTGGPGNVLYGTTGSSWSNTQVSASELCTNISYVNSNFVAFAPGSTTYYYASNPNSWTAKTSGFPTATEANYNPSIRFYGTKYVIVIGGTAYTTTALNTAFASSGTVFSNLSTLTSLGGNLFVSSTAGLVYRAQYTPSSGIGSITAVSADAVTWTVVNQVTDSTTPQHGLANNNGVYLPAMSTSVASAFTAGSGVFTNKNQVAVTNVGSAGTSYVGINNGYLYLSTDGATWTNQNVACAAVNYTKLQGALNSGIYVVLISSGNIVTSNDSGSTWNTYNLMYSTNSVMLQLSYANGQYLATDSTGMLYRSVAAPTTIGTSKATLDGTKPVYLRIG